MIQQQDIIIDPKENAGSLHDKLMLMGSALVLTTVASIESGDIKTIPQRETEGIRTAYKLNKDNCKINWRASIDDIYNQIRGLSPYPGAWSTLINGEDTLDVKIYKAEKELTEHHLETGAVISTKKELKVAVPKGYIILKELNFQVNVPWM